MGNVIDSLKVILGIETKGFQGVGNQIKSLTEGAHHEFAQLKNAIAGYFTVEAAKELVHSVTEMGERWYSLSKITRLSTDEVQRYDKYLKRVGLTIEDLQQSFELVGDKKEKALLGGSELQEFQRLGISEDDLKNKSNIDIMKSMNAEDNVAMDNFFGRRRGQKTAAGIRSIKEGGDVPIASEKDIILLHESAEKFQTAVLEFKVATIPIVTWLARQAGSSLQGEGIGQYLPYSIAARIAGHVVGSTEGTSAELGEKGIAAEERKRRANAPGGRNSIFSASSPLPRPNVSVTDGGSFAQPDSRFAFPVTDEQKKSSFARGKEQLEKQRIALQDAAFGVVFSASTTANQKSMINKQANEKLDEAKKQHDLGNFDKENELQADVLRLAEKRSKLEKQYGSGFKADSMAAHGGFIGGAAAGIDPSITVLQDQLSVQKQFLQSLKELPPAILKAFTEAMRGQPVDQIQ